LATALQENVCRDLLAIRAGKSATVLTRQLIKRLQKETGLMEENARWAVESWAMALRVDFSPQLAIQSEKIQSQNDIEWKNRTLCSYESCIGVIGIDGRCEECGRFNERKPTATNSPVEAGKIGKVLSKKDSSESELDIDWENRTLCIDESCIGVIGIDGCCKECGRPYRPTSENDIDWENRTLCIDESCIGVVGSDGRCKECGRAYE
jgi:hypothetical protein